MATPKQTMALATLAAAAGLVIGRNWDEVAALLGPTAQGVEKAAGAAYRRVLRFALQQKEAVDDMMVELSVKAAAEEG